MFESYFNHMSFVCAGESGTAEIERAFWRNVSLNPAIYGADTPGTLFPASVTEWNLDNLPGLLNRSSIGGIHC